MTAGGKLADEEILPAAKFVAKGDWICRSRRARQIHLQEAKIASDFYFIRAIFAFVGFVSALSARPLLVGRARVSMGPKALAAGWDLEP